MATRPKPKKPTGTSGISRISAGPEGRMEEFLHLEFPKTKEEIEEFIVHGFLRNAKAMKVIPEIEIEVIQNPQDDFDFTLKLSTGEQEYLELMEIAPLEFVRGAYEKAPSSYKPYDLAEYILQKALSKSSRYVGSKREGILLLIYITDWRFILSESCTRILKAWLDKYTHSFKEIYLYSPMSPSEGLAELLYPVQGSYGLPFVPEQFKDNIVYNQIPLGLSPPPPSS